MSEGWGGKRENAGRPKNPEGVRKQRQVRAYDDEWEMIKAFAKLVKEDKPKAAKLLKLV